MFSQTISVENLNLVLRCHLNSPTQFQFYLTQTLYFRMCLTQVQTGGFYLEKATRKLAVTFLSLLKMLSFQTYFERCRKIISNSQNYR